VFGVIHCGVRGNVVLSLDEELEDFFIFPVSMQNHRNLRFTHEKNFKVSHKKEESHKVEVLERIYFSKTG
jgi:hypothetical protein